MSETGSILVIRESEQRWRRCSCEGMENAELKEVYAGRVTEEKAQELHITAF